jgi:diguanylate cyclase (GGDEF)-like protein
LGAGLYLLQGRDTHGLPNFQRLAGDLPNQTVDKLLEAPDGTIWASTDNGLATVDPVSFAIHPIRQAGGIGILNYWNSSGAISPAGLAMFGGQGGLTVIDPALAKPSAYVAPVAVTDVTIGGKPAPPSAFSRFYPEAVLEVSPGENSFAVEFAALDYADPMQNLYSYRLAGYDHDWIETPATRRLASYTNLPTGHYRLELRGSNRNGVWGEPLSIRVYVRPAWFQTVWAKIGAAFLFLLSLFALFQLGRRVAAARQRELEQQVSLRTEELRQSQLQLEEMAYYDSLTGLANRRMFAERFRRLLAMKRRQPGGFCLLTFDMDYFKAINDECGHGAGDALLKEVALRLAPVVRELDCFARMGGDEFAMLLDQPYNEKNVEIVCLRIAASLSEPLMHEGLSLTATFSIGVAAFPQDGEDEDTLFKSADIALYQVKRGGRNGWRKYRDE